MSKKIVAAASLSRSQFETFLAGSKASPASKARYEREWKAKHDKTTSTPKGKKQVTKGRPALPGHGYRKPEKKEVDNSKKANVRTKTIVQEQKRPESPKTISTKKEVVTKKTRYPIGQKRLNVDYKVAKADFARYDKSTEARYWSAWQKYKLDHSAHKEQPSYRIILSYRAKIDGHVMKDSDGKDVVFHWSTVVNKKRLSKKDLALEAEEIKVTTNVQVFDVRHVIAYDNWTGQQV